jgi:hypothetical protein
MSCHNAINRRVWSKTFEKEKMIAKIVMEQI